MVYKVVEVRGDDEFILMKTEDKTEAVDQARREWNYLRDADKKTGYIEVREYENDPDETECYDCDLIEWRSSQDETYDSFRVSACFEGGHTIDNDIVNTTGEEAVEAELEEAREWFADKNPMWFIVSYYKDGECVNSEVR